MPPRAGEENAVMNDTPAAGNGLASYRVRLVLDFEAGDEGPHGFGFLASYLKTLLSLPRGANLSFETIAAGFPGARARSAAVEVVRPDGDTERREMTAP